MRDLDRSSESHIFVEKHHSTLKISFNGWVKIIMATIHTLIDGPYMLVAAGCAFFSTLSLFPSISSLISIYGLVFDPQTVEPQLEFLQHFFPPNVYVFLQEMINSIVEQTHSTLTIQLVVSILFALWSASIGTKGLVTGLNVAYNTHETRSFLKFQVLSVVLTFCAILGTIMTLAVIVALPAILNILPYQFLNILTDYFPAYNMVRISSNIIVFLFATWTFALFYRFGPCRSNVHWRWTCPGAFIATILWLLAAFSFSYYVAHFANFTSTYGPLGTVVAVMMWFLVSCYVVLVGAQFNAQIEGYILDRSEASNKIP